MLGGHWFHGGHWLHGVHNHREFFLKSSLHLGAMIASALATGYRYERLTA